MKRRAKNFALIGVGGGMLLLLTLLLGENVVSGSLAERRSFRESTSRQALADAETLAHTLDGYIRIAENILAAADLRLGSGRHSSADSALLEAIYRIPEAANAYLLDASGKIVAAAWKDRVDEPVIARERLDRIALARGSEALIADSPHGPVLAVVRALEGRSGARFAVIAFDEIFFDARLALARSDEYTATAITDAFGRELVEGDRSILSNGGPPANAVDFVWAETSLPTHPLRVLVVHDLRPGLRAWHSRFILLISILAILVAALGSVSGMAAVEVRRAREAMALQDELDARDRLFHEVNHRVKNNLATVQAILRLGESEIADKPERAPEILRSAAERIDSIGKLHEHLYSRKSITEIDLGTYLEELAESLGRSYGEPKNVSLAVRADPGIPATLDVGVPVALIVNELVTNSFKHAFPDKRRGSIQVELSKGAGGGFAITVSDDGVGIVDERESGGFGRSLVVGLARQIGATLAPVRDIPGSSGTTWRLSVPPPAP